MKLYRILLVSSGRFGELPAFVYRPNLKELTSTVKEISDLLHETREDYVLRSDCKDRCGEFRYSLVRIEHKLDNGK